MNLRASGYLSECTEVFCVGIGRTNCVYIDHLGVRNRAITVQLSEKKVKIA